jgi:soluble lytic murein transglycosylase-like protein
VFKTIKLITIVAVAGIVPAVGAQAAGKASDAAGGATAKLDVLERPGERFERSVEAHEKLLQRLAERRRERREARQPDFAPPERYGVDQATLDSIADCESGGDPTAVSADGTYRGKYQFDSGTWASMGGSGDPAAAPEPEQDMRAAMLYSQSGSSPWPICGS